MIPFDRAEEICRRLETLDLSLQKVAEDYGISRQRVSSIVKQRNPELLEKRRAHRHAVLQERIAKRAAEKDKRMTSKLCYVCTTEFTYSSRMERRFCSPDCRRLYRVYLRYYIDASMKVHQAKHVLRKRDEATPSQVRFAEKVVAEWETTGTYKVTRRIPTSKPPVVAQMLADKIGITLVKTREKVMAKEGLHYPNDNR